MFETIDPLLVEVIYVVLGILGGTLLGRYATDLRYKKGKKILGEVRKLVDHVDDAVYDDKVTEEEFRLGWEKFKGVLSAVFT